MYDLLSLFAKYLELSTSYQHLDHYSTYYSHASPEPLVMHVNWRYIQLGKC
jgi:hypothetical protein